MVQLGCVLCLFYTLLVPSSLDKQKCCAKLKSPPSESFNSASVALRKQVDAVCFFALCCYLIPLAS